MCMGCALGIRGDGGGITSHNDRCLRMEEIHGFYHVYHISKTIPV
jgi:hypothetical protein